MTSRPSTANGKCLCILGCWPGGAGSQRRTLGQTPLSLQWTSENSSSVLYCVKHRLGHTSKYGRGGLPLRLAPVTVNTRTELKHENTPHTQLPWTLRQTRKHWLHRWWTLCLLGHLPGPYDQKLLFISPHLVIHLIHPTLATITNRVFFILFQNRCDHN